MSLKLELFNLDNTNDLPEYLTRELLILNVREDTRKLLLLFNLKKSLSLDEILVGLYRVHKIQKTRYWVNTTLYNLSKKNLIKRIGRGVYKSVENGMQDGYVVLGIEPVEEKQ